MKRLSLKLFATSAFGAVLLNLPGGDSLSPFASASPLPDDQQLTQQDASLWLGLGDGPEEKSLSQSEKAEGIVDEEELDLSETSAENIDRMDEKAKAKAAKDAWATVKDKTLKTPELTQKAR